MSQTKSRWSSFPNHIFIFLFNFLIKKKEDEDQAEYWIEVGFQQLGFSTSTLTEIRACPLISIKEFTQEPPSSFVSSRRRGKGMKFLLPFMFMPGHTNMGNLALPSLFEVHLSNQLPIVTRRKAHSFMDWPIFWLIPLSYSFDLRQKSYKDFHSMHNGRAFYGFHKVNEWREEYMSEEIYLYMIIWRLKQKVTK